MRIILASSLPLAVTLPNSVSGQFEEHAMTNRYYSGPLSDHFDGQVFFNPGGKPPGSFGDLLRWRFGEKRTPWPQHWPSPFHGTRPPVAVNGGEISVTMIGHATLLIQVDGINLLTDPVFSLRASPWAFIGPRRVNPPGVALADLPLIDAVLLTHNHYDHLDLATLIALVARDNPLIVTPLGNDTIVRSRAPAARFHVGDWGDVVELGHRIRAHFEPAHHWSARQLGDRRMALWCAFLIETPAGRIYHIGDTGFHDGIHFRAIAEKHGPIRLAILPIGAYEPRWFMAGQHMNPDEAVRGFRLSEAEHALGHHWGTFHLTDEAIDAPLGALEVALDRHGVATDRYLALWPGQSVSY